MLKSPVDYFNIAFPIIMLRRYLNEAATFIWFHCSSEYTKMQFTVKYEINFDYLRPLVESLKK